MKRRLRLFPTLTAAAMLTAAVPTALAAGTNFTDVPDGAWYETAVAYVRDNNIMGGTSETTFSPDRTMTRAMLAAVLYRAAGSPAVNSSAAFPDVASDAYYADAVSWASANGIVSGYSDGRFGADDPVNRGQIAAILWRYAGSPAADAGQDFADESSIPAYAAAAVDWARANGVISGRDGNRFDAQGNATRAQVAVILRNYLTMQQNSQQPAETPAAPDSIPDTSTSENGKVLVAYFSGSGNTERVAETIASELNADIFEITPATPYTSDDLNYNDSSSRVNQEHEDESLRDVPLVTTMVENWDDYDTVFLGYPIWWGIAAWPVNTFVKDNDFTGKTVIPFATSSSSGMGQSGDLLHQMTTGGVWLNGQRFASGASDGTVRSWVDGLNIGQ